MSLRKRLEGSREERAQARAKRREEARRAEEAKRVAKAERARPKAAKAKAGKPPPAKPKSQTPRAEKPKTAAKAGPSAKARDKPRAGGARTRSRFGRPREQPAKRGEPARAGRGRAVAADARKLGGSAASAGSEVLKLGREMLVIPVQLWLAAAEIAGAFVLKVWLRVVRPALLALWRLGCGAVRFADRHLTPARAVGLVAVVACGALAASQWLDYHAVTVGVDAYAGEVGVVAPAPEVESEIAGNAHAWVMLPLAVAALVAIGFAAAGRRRVAALLVPIGLAVVAIALIVDVPKGLDEGSAELAYEDASAALLEGFWVQLAAAAVLIACGLLLPRYLRPRSAKEAAATPTGPSLFDKLGTAAGKAARRAPSLPKPNVSLPKRSRPKRKVQGART